MLARGRRPSLLLLLGLPQRLRQRPRRQAGREQRRAAARENASDHGEDRQSPSAEHGAVSHGGLPCANSSPAQARSPTRAETRAKPLASISCATERRAPSPATETSARLRP